MTVADFKQGFKYYTITYMHVGWKTSFIEKRSSVNKRLYKFNFTITEEDYNIEPGYLATLAKRGQASPSSALQTFSDMQEGEEAQNVQTAEQSGSREGELLENLSKHLKEGKNSILQLVSSHEAEHECDFEGASDISDAMDLMLGGDIELLRQSQEDFGESLV